MQFKKHDERPSEQFLLRCPQQKKRSKKAKADRNHSSQHLTLKPASPIAPRNKTNPRKQIVLQVLRPLNNFRPQHQVPLKQSHFQYAYILKIGKAHKIRENNPHPSLQVNRMTSTSTLHTEKRNQA